MKIRDKEGTPKNFCHKDFAELSGELSGAICLKTLVLLGSALELFRKLFGAGRAMFGFGVRFLLLKKGRVASYGNPECGCEQRSSQGDRCLPSTYF